MYKPKTLTEEQIERFTQEGYLLVREAFSSATAEAILPLIWKEAPVDPEDRSNWRQRRYVIQKSLAGEETRGLYSERTTGTFDDLLGEGRYRQPGGTGYLLLGLPGFSEPPWSPPLTGWHIDGVHFHHHTDSREQGLVGLFLFTDIHPGGGGTVVRPGSHRITARILKNAEPEGLTLQELCRRVGEETQELPVVEVTGNAGDLVALHPHTYHGSSDNCSDRIRVASNMCISLHERLNLDRADAGDYSPVERAIVEALWSEEPQETRFPSQGSTGYWTC